MHAEANYVLPFCSHLHVVTRFQTAVSHVIFFHLHEGRVRIRLGTRVAISQHNFILFILDQSGQKIFVNLFLRFFDFPSFFWLRIICQNLIQPLGKCLQRFTVDPFSTPQFFQIFIPIVCVFLSLQFVYLFKQLTHFLFQGLASIERAFLPYKAVTVGVGFNLGAIHKIVLQFDVTTLNQLFQHFREHTLDLPLQALTAKTVDGTEVWLVPTTQPHVVDILPHQLGYLTP